jgi:hypothetical protein
MLHDQVRHREVSWVAGAQDTVAVMGGGRDQAAGLEERDPFAREGVPPVTLYDSRTLAGTARTPYDRLTARPAQQAQPQVGLRE